MSSWNPPLQRWTGLYQGCVVRSIIKWPKSKNVWRYAELRTVITSSIAVSRSSGRRAGEICHWERLDLGPRADDAGVGEAAVDLLPLRGGPRRLGAAAGEKHVEPAGLWGMGHGVDVFVWRI